MRAPGALQHVQLHSPSVLSQHKRPDRNSWQGAAGPACNE
jgi:hypothetical protein